MHADRAFAEALVAMGNCAHTAVEITGGCEIQWNALDD